jgi:hypothetical protein
MTGDDEGIGAAMGESPVKGVARRLGAVPGRLRGRLGAPLEAWEAVLPGVVLPALALWLGGSEWGDRGLAAAANLAPVCILALLAGVGGRRVAAIQATATLVYGAVGLGWLGEGTGWEFPPLPVLADHASLFLPLAAAGAGIPLFVALALGIRLVTGTGTLARG